MSNDIRWQQRFSNYKKALLQLRNGVDLAAQRELSLLDAKGTNFKTQNSKVTYKNETFDEIHTLGKSYDEIEKPFIIHPEKEDVLQYIKYDKEGKVSSENPRVQHTIEEACKLNREELVQKRLSIVNDFINQINKHYILFKQEKGSLSRFQPDIETFVEKATNENEFYSFRNFILHNIEIFFEKKAIQQILISLMNKMR